jgi:hypothetical protein
MKRLFSIKTFAVALAAVSVLVSCEEDSDSPSKLSGSEFTAAETAGTLTLGFQLDNPVSKDTEVTFDVTGGTATEGEDFELVESSGTLVAGETNGKFSINLLNDLEDEEAETVIVTITSGGISGEYTLTITDDDCPFEWIGALGGTDANLDKGDFLGVADVVISEDGGTYTIEGLNTDFIANFWGETIIDQVPVTFTVDGGGNITIPDQYIFTTLYDGDEYPYHIYGTGVVNTCDGNVTIDYELDQEGFLVGNYVHNTGKWMTDPIFKAVLVPNE